MPNNVTVDTICNDILEIALHCRNELTQQLIDLLYSRCIEYGYNFIDSSDSKQQESLGKGKDFVYSENTCNKKPSSESLPNENKLSEKSEKSINDASLDPLSGIKNLRLRKVNKVIIGNININSLPNKFKQLKELVMKHIDILVITETKLDDSFPTSLVFNERFCRTISIRSK